VKGPPPPAPRHGTIAELLAAAGSHASGVTFLDLREREVAMSWAEVLGRARKVAGALVGKGVGQGDRVAIVLRTEPAFLDAFFGTTLAGAVPVPLYPPVRLGRLEEWVASTARMIAASGARLVVSGGASRRLLGEAVARARPPLGMVSAAELLRGPALARSASPDDLGLVQFSSGSTVDPKPVALTHRAILSQVAALTALGEPTAEDVLVSWLPLYHDMGLIGGLLAAASYPGPLVLIPPEHFLARPGIWLRAIGRYRGTISAAPSFAYAYCADRVADEELQGLSLASWRLALDGAEPVSPRALRRFAERFERHGLDPRALCPGYGLSEAALAVTFSPRRWPPRTSLVDARGLALSGEVRLGSREIVSLGPPIPGAEVEVRDDEGRPLPDGWLGRVVVRSPSLMREYLGQPEATDEVLSDGWLDTGDLGFTEAGELYIHGRARDAVVVRGASHAPEEFEAALEGLGGIRAGCCTALGVEDDDGVEGLVILAEREQGGESKGDGERAAAVARAVTVRTGVAPRQVRILEPGTLPRTSSGKMRRSEARHRLAAGTLLAPGGASALGLAGQMARSAWALARVRRASEPDAS
jgi:acyl-CoA synthetase (AMP-forming)/AMP-acid ligase II